MVGYKSKPRTWAQISYSAFQRLLWANAAFPDQPEELLRWQVAILTGRTKQQVDAWPMARIERWHLSRDFLRNTPTVAANPTLVYGHRRYRLPHDLGDLPLAAWLYLERTLPEATNRPIPALAVAMAATQASFEANALPGLEQKLEKMPVPTVLGLVQGLTEALGALHAQYPEVFGTPGAADTPPQPLGPGQHYLERWGWNALLAELNGGHLPPADREAWLAAPVHVVFQELSRRNDWAALLHASSSSSTV